MLRNNKVNAVIAFVAAVLLWVYVVGQVNPETNGRITGVPVVFAGEDILEENELALVDPGELTVDVVVRGSRSDVRKVISNSDRVTAVANVSGLSKGTHSVTLDITVPSSVDLQKSSIDEVTVEIDDLATKNINVEIRYDGVLPESQEPGAAVIDPAVITVTGAASTVSTIDHLEAVVPIEELQEQVTKLTKDVIPVNLYGQEVEHVKLAASRVDISVALVETKTVALKAETTGTPADGFEVKEMTYPDTVTVCGPHTALAELTEVTAEPVDVSGLSEDSTVALKLQLPDGVELKEPKEAEALVKIAASSSKSFTFGAADITISGIPEGMKAELAEQAVTVTASADADVLDTLKKSDIKLEVSADGLAEGTHEVPVKLVSDQDSSIFTIDPEKVTLKIEAQEAEGQE